MKPFRFRLTTFFIVVYGISLLFPSVVDCTPTLQRFPNPVEKPWCRSPSSSSSSSITSFDRICDPDEYLSYDAAANIQMLTKKIQTEIPHTCSNGKEISGYEIVTIITQTLPSSSTYTTAERLAKYWHDTWGIGDTVCSNGIVLYLAILDRQVFISTGKDTKTVLTDDTLTEIINDMKPDLRAQKYGDGIMKALMHMHDILHGGTFTSFHRNSVLVDNSSDIVFFILIVILFNVFLLVSCVQKYRHDQRIRQEQQAWNEVRRYLLQIERLQEEENSYVNRHGTAAHVPTTDPVDNMATSVSFDGNSDTMDAVSGSATHLRNRRQPSTADNPSGDGTHNEFSGAEGALSSRFAPLASRMTCCPICLEDFPQRTTTVKNKENKEEDTTDNEKKELLLSTDGTAKNGSKGSSSTNVPVTDTKVIVTLPCHHRFHVECIDGWFGSQQKTTCPVCRAVTFGPGSSTNPPSVPSSSSSSSASTSSSSFVHPAADSSTTASEPQQPRSTIPPVRPRTTATTTTTTTTTTTSTRSFASPEPNDNRSKESSSSTANPHSSTSTTTTIPRILEYNFNNILLRRLEIEFLLRSLSRRYPTVVTPTLLNTWTNQVQNPTTTTTTTGVPTLPVIRFTQTDTFRNANPLVRESALQQYQQNQIQRHWNGGSNWGSGSFGGGSSFGGGGRGGSW